jgi:hypothetical protein
MDENIAKKVLEEISKRLVMKKEELVDFLKNEQENSLDLFREITQSLSTQGFIQYVNEIGAYTVTKKGIREAVK